MHIQGKKLAVDFGVLEKPAEDGMQRGEICCIIYCTKDIQYL